MSKAKLSPLGDRISRVRSTMKTLSARPLLAAILAVMLVVGPASPVFGQDTPQNAQAAPAKYNFSHAPRAFPNIFAPYAPIKIGEPGLTNSPRVDQLIHDGKLELTLQEAVELALENNMDIVV